MNLLLVTYHFKPEKTVGADRPNSLYTYASENDIHIDVITASPASQVENGVYRIAGSSGWYRPPISLKKIIGKAVTKMVEPFYFNTDWYWVMRVKQFTKRKLCTGMYDAVYVIYPHVHALEAAWFISSYLNVPLISDFTDCIGYYPLELPNIIQKGTRFRFERRVLEKSAAAITIATEYKQYFESISPTPAYLVYNGYDEHDFEGISSRKAASGEKRNSTKFVHFGSINASRKRNVKPLFDAIARLKSSKSHPLFMVDFIGNYTPDERRLVDTLNIQDVVSFIPYMDKKAGLQLITREYDFLLFYGVPNQSSTVCSKLLEYLRLYKPIIGVCKGNEAEHIIKRAGAGEIADFSAAEIEHLFQKALKHEIFYSPDHDYIRHFNRKSQAREIFSIVKSCVKAE